MSDRADALRLQEGDPPYAWFRLAISLLVTTIGGVGLWSVVVALPAVEAEFQVARADAALPYTLLMVGFAVGGCHGRLSLRIDADPSRFVTESDQRGCSLAATRRGRRGHRRQ